MASPPAGNTHPANPTCPCLPALPVQVRLWPHLQVPPPRAALGACSTDVWDAVPHAVRGGWRRLTYAQHSAGDAQAGERQRISGDGDAGRPWRQRAARLLPDCCAIHRWALSSGQIVSPLPQVAVWLLTHRGCADERPGGCLPEHTVLLPATDPAPCCLRGWLQAAATKATPAGPGACTCLPRRAPWEATRCLGGGTTARQAPAAAGWPHHLRRRLLLPQQPQRRRRQPPLACQRLWRCTAPPLWPLLGPLQRLLLCRHPSWCSTARRTRLTSSRQPLSTCS